MICRNQIRLREACNFRKKNQFHWNRTAVGMDRKVEDATCCDIYRSTFASSTIENKIQLSNDRQLHSRDGEIRVQRWERSNIGSYVNDCSSDQSLLNIFKKMFWKFPPKNSFISLRCPWALTICFEDWSHNKTHSAIAPAENIAFAAKSGIHMRANLQVPLPTFIGDFESLLMSHVSQQQKPNKTCEILNKTIFRTWEFSINVKAKTFTLVRAFLCQNIKV